MNLFFLRSYFLWCYIKTYYDPHGMNFTIELGFLLIKCTINYWATFLKDEKNVVFEFTRFWFFVMGSTETTINAVQKTVHSIRLESLHRLTILEEQEREMSFLQYKCTRLKRIIRNFKILFVQNLL